MGYRSDVRLVTSRKGYKVLDDYVKQYLRDNNKSRNWNLLKRPSFIKHTSKATYIGWNDIKWNNYAPFMDTDSLMSGLEYLKENDYSFRFSRMGESYDDYEELYNESYNPEEQYLIFPCVIREFDDEFVIKELEQDAKTNNYDIEM